MPGQQLNIQATGAGYEAFAEAVLGRIAAMVPVPRAHDFGLDFYVLPRVPLSPTLEAAVALCGIQVKGADKLTIAFGGLNKKGEWKQYEIEWLRALDVPFYIAVSDTAFSSISLYSTGPALGVFWRAGTPFEIRCSFGAPSSGDEHTFVDPVSEQASEATAMGDDRRWTVDLGAPFLNLRLADLVDKSHRENLRNVLLAWIHTDRASLFYRHMGVPRQHLRMAYRTNIVPQAVQDWMFWNPAPGASSTGLEQTVGPIATVLVQHLLGQKDTVGLQAWLPALEWLASRNSLDGLGVGAIREIREAKP